MRDKAPALYAGTMAKALAGTASPRSAIKAMCLQCAGYDRRGIVECQVSDCPLYAYRPFIKAKKRGVKVETPAERSGLAI